MLRLDLAVLRQLETGAAPPAGGSIWRDEHVQKQLLRAHLDESHDLATRAPATVEATIDWLVEGLPRGAEVLDLGCGPGLYAQRLADRGFDVTGPEPRLGGVGDRGVLGPGRVPAAHPALRR